MSSPLSSVRLEIPSAPDAQIEVHSLKGHEAISQLFAFEIEFWSP